ncbi:MAG: asparagine synthase (glutamine-hydrolyzing) [Saprospiraceae bacterium]|nr:asparagine synthase (glutamine-hydrolyzing) [Saprospiraceae bacterium]
MCGICGIIHPGNKNYHECEPVVRKMMAGLKHRGPDDSGFYADINCVLGMRRLAIIDLHQGQQPLYNEQRTILAFFNGEIYNYRELKASLEDLGHLFTTNSDTEVLVHLYEEYGVKMLAHLKGMFAFCIYDKSENTYLFARDRFGEKPLFYHVSNEVFSFSSELGSLIENREIPRQLDEEALNYYLKTSLVPEPLTMFKNIKQLPSGHYMLWKNGQVDVRQYYYLSYQVDDRIKTDSDAIDYIKPLLAQAVSRQMVSDVPIGAFLSGGLDSSSLVAIMQRHREKPLKTFTVKFADEKYDESHLAAKVAAHCGTDHQQIEIPNYDFEESMFWQIISHVGQPFRDTSAIPTFFISREIAKHVKVAISGDGGDELFGGYSIFDWYLKIEHLQKWPRAIRRLTKNGIKQLQNLSYFHNSSKIRQAGRAIDTSLLTAADIPISLNEMFTPQDIGNSGLRTAETHGESKYALLKHRPDEFGSWSPLRRIMYYRLRYTLAGNMLVKVDRMSMANSLEVRAPFLDPDLFEATAKLPDRFLIRSGVKKYLLREIMKPTLPDAVFQQSKHGFNIPLHSYQNQNYKRLAQNLLFDENPLPHLFPGSFLENVYNRGIKAKKDNSEISVYRASHQLWMMMQLFGWAKKYEVSQ